MLKESVLSLLLSFNMVFTPPVSMGMGTGTSLGNNPQNVLGGGYF